MSATVPTTTEFNALAAKVTTVTTQQTATATGLTAAEARLAALETRVAALETPVLPPPPPVVTAPLTVTDLAVVSATETALTVRFTEVADGMGAPASYQLRYQAGTITWGSAPELLLVGAAIGVTRTYTVGGLLPGTAYQVQIVAYRGTLNVNAVFGGLSNVASGTTAAVVAPPPVVIPPPSAGLLFASDWLSGTPKDNWDLYDEWTGAIGSKLMSVAPGFAPGGRNALRVLQHGELAAAVQKKNTIPAGTDFYVRFYFRNDDTSSPGDHCAAGDVFEYPNLTLLRKSSGPNDWQHIISVYGCGYVYPVGHWTLRARLARLAWYRMEYFVHWTSPTAIQVHPRVYDAAGTLLFQDADYQQSDFGSSGLWNGSQTWTLASYYAAGRDFCVHPEFLTGLGIGNNGQAGAADTGLPWYFAGVQIRTDRWPGP